MISRIGDANDLATLRGSGRKVIMNHSCLYFFKLIFCCSIKVEAIGLLTPHSYTGSITAGL